MEAFLQALIGVLTPYINRRVDTGDRNYDIAVAGFITMCLSSVLFWSYKKLSDRKFRNWLRWLRYTYWYHHTDPFEFKNHWYEYATPDEIKYISVKTPLIPSNLKCYWSVLPILRMYAVKCETSNVNIIGYHPFFYDGQNMIYVAIRDSGEYLSLCCESDTIRFANLHLYCLKLLEDMNNVPKNTKNRKIHSKTGVLGNIGTHKTFDTIFYDQKVEVLDAVTKFKEGRLYPKGISMDNKLGILLYGPPGTGKTGTISACANLLGRDVMVLDFSVIKTCEELDNVLKPEEFDKYIYVFDEFDCILDVLVSDEKKAVAEADKEDTTDWSKLLMVAEGEERKQILEMLKEGRTKQKDKSQSLNLGYLLRKLDGLEDATGRFIIATTNNPDHIHPALLRPGRFDIKLCLGNCSAKMYVDILGAFFELDDTGRATVAAAGLPVGRWSPLQTINMALTKKTLGATLEALNV